MHNFTLFLALLPSWLIVASIELQENKDSGLPFRVLRHFSDCLLLPWVSKPWLKIAPPHKLPEISHSMWCWKTVKVYSGAGNCRLFPSFLTLVDVTAVHDLQQEKVYREMGGQGLTKWSLFSNWRWLPRRSCPVIIASSCGIWIPGH